MSEGLRFSFKIISAGGENIGILRSSVDRQPRETLRHSNRGREEVLGPVLYPT